MSSPVKAEPNKGCWSCTRMRAQCCHWARWSFTAAQHCLCADCTLLAEGPAQGQIAFSDLQVTIVPVWFCFLHIFVCAHLSCSFSQRGTYSPCPIRPLLQTVTYWSRGTRQIKFVLSQITAVSFTQGLIAKILTCSEVKLLQLDKLLIAHIIHWPLVTAYMCTHLLKQCNCSFCPSVSCCTATAHAEVGHILPIHFIYTGFLCKLLLADSMVNGEKQAVPRHESPELTKKTHLEWEELYKATYFSPSTTKRW